MARTTRKKGKEARCNLSLCRPQGIEPEMEEYVAHLDGDAAEKARIYKALSAEARVKILRLLAKRPMCGCEIVVLLGLAQSTVSHHLSILKKAGLIIEEKKERWNNYYLSYDLSKKISPF